MSYARVMPNIAMKVNCGCSGLTMMLILKQLQFNCTYKRLLFCFFSAVFTMDQNSSEQDKELLSKLLCSVGLSFEVLEHEINAYCGLFSSGIGFVMQCKNKCFIY
jgi:pyrroline-5-carboxylate reductase